VSGDFAYVADALSGLAIINVSDPTNLGTPVYEDTAGDARGVYVSGDYAYLATRSAGLAVINVSDPTNPGTPVYEDTAGEAYGVHVSGDSTRQILEHPSINIRREMHMAFTSAEISPTWLMVIQA